MLSAKGDLPPASAFVDQLLRSRSRGAIAWGRLVAAYVVIAAVWLDPSQPEQFPGVTKAALIGYAALAIMGVWRQRMAPGARGRLGLPGVRRDAAVQAAEFLFFVLLVHATGGVGSPFFLLFTFSVLGSTFLWGWRGCLWTSVAVLAVLLAFAALQIRDRPFDPTEADRFLLRVAHVAVVGALMTTFAFHKERAEGEVLRLASWAPSSAELGDLPAYLEGCARYAAAVFAAPRVVLAVQARGELSAHRVVLEGGAARHDRPAAPDGGLPAWPPDPDLLTGRCDDAHLVALSAMGRVGTQATPAWFRRLGEQARARHLLCAPIATDLYTGALVILDRPDQALAEMTAAHLAARQVEAGLMRMGEIAAMRRAAASEERLRTARDLHDGVLQTLAATAMHVESIRRAPETPRLAIAALHEWLIKEQRALRRMIERLRDEPAVPSPDLEDHDIAGVAQGVGERWGIRVHLLCQPPGLRLDRLSGFEVRQIVGEAAANAVRHGGATELRVQMAASPGRLAITIDDNGAGPAPAAAAGAVGDPGPRTLRERVRALGGTLSLRPAGRGLGLDIVLPLPDGVAT